MSSETMSYNKNENVKCFHLFPVSSIIRRGGNNPVTKWTFIRQTDYIDEISNGK